MGVVTAEQSGFKMAARSGVPLSVDQVQRVDLRLEAGDIAERVEVTSSALALDTASATVGRTITEKQVTELPLNGGNFLQLLSSARGRRNHRRAGRHAAGRGQRHQHHGGAPDLQ